ncbi:MAG: hypothetical protein GX600_03270 [Dehalococcoidia bacterium]|jgi:hypothetical protein|nr:hypothetical protein [Dehalococcoidia bacterium]
MGNLRELSNVNDVSRVNAAETEPEGHGGKACGLKDAGAFECGCCGMSGRGGKLRIGLLIVLAVVVVILLVQGFSAAG